MAGSFSSLARAPLEKGRVDAPFAAPGALAHEAPLENVGRRSAPRLRLSIPAKLVTITQTLPCVLLDVSRTGAQVSLPEPLPLDAACFVRFADYEVFATVVRCVTGLNGVQFDDALGDGDVLAVRSFAESYEAAERAALKANARAWVTGRR